MMDPKTILYFPEHIKNIEEFKRLTHAYDEELKLLWAALRQQETNLDLSAMDEATCDRWAELLGIQYIGSETLADKRRIIKGAWTSGLPYTERKFAEVLDSMIGPNLYTLLIDKTEKSLTVNVMLAEVSNVKAVADLMRAMAPADMTVLVEVIFNRWSTFAPYEWDDLDGYTWEHLYSDPSWQEEEGD